MLNVNERRRQFNHILRGVRGQLFTLFIFLNSLYRTAADVAETEKQEKTEE